MWLVKIIYYRETLENVLGGERGMGGEGKGKQSIIYKMYKIKKLSLNS